MVEINGKFLCENCFEEKTNPQGFCIRCGYNPDAGMSDPTMLTPGSILLGKYIVGKVMGKGGFGVTYLAYDVTANRKVAIKEFFPYGIALRAAGSATVTVTNEENANAFKIGAEKFYNEAKLVSKFNGNPNIVGVYEFFYENDTVYFAMEYLKGHTLKEHIDKNGPLSPGQALFIAQSVANALMAAHSSNVLHRDISPDNIIICDNGDVKLIDFGAARQVVAEHSQSFSVILKPGFAPLEQYQKKGKQGPWTDIYSLGATIYYSLTEDIPEDPMSRLDDDAEFSSNMYNINPELWRFISKATQLKIEDRYGDIFQLRNDLSTITVEAVPLVVPPAEEAGQMPDFSTAKPFGMTQMGEQQAQPVQQPVGVGAPVQPVQPAQAVPSAGYYETAPGQPAALAQRAVPAVKKNISIKTAVIAISAALAAAAAAVIIPISVNKAKNYSGGSAPAYSTPSAAASTPSVVTSTSEAETSTPPAEISTPPEDGTTTVTKKDMGNGIYYSGEWKDEEPYGQGTLWCYENGTYELIKGAFKGVASFDGGFLSVDSDGNYEFYYGHIDNGVYSGSGYCEYYYNGGSNEIYYGTFEEGFLREGEHFFNGANISLSVGRHAHPSSGGVRIFDGYYFDYTKSGELRSITKVEKARDVERITESEAANISEIKKYNLDYIKKVLSNHYEPAYNQIFKTLAADIETAGGPRVK